MLFIKAGFIRIELTWRYLLSEFCSKQTRDVFINQFHLSLWVGMLCVSCCESLLVAMGCYGLLRVVMGCYGLLRVVMGCYGLLRVVIGCYGLPLFAMVVVKITSFT